MGRDRGEYKTHVSGQETRRPRRSRVPDVQCYRNPVGDGWLVNTPLLIDSSNVYSMFNLVHQR